MMQNIALPALNSDAGLIKYLDQIHKLPFLEAEEEYMLAKKWQLDKDVESAQKLTLSHLRLVSKIAMKFKNYGLSMFDLISEGNIGLMHAIEKFNPDKGFRLATYAIWWINSYIHDYILKSWSLVKIGTNLAQKKLFFNLRKIKNRIKKFDDSSLSDEEISVIANELNVDKSEVSDMDARLATSDTSLNQLVYGNDDDSTEMINLIEDENVPNQENMVIEYNERQHKLSALHNALENLSEREKDIITLRKLQQKPATLEDLSQKYSISRERIRQIEIKALEKLKDFLS